MLTSIILYTLATWGGVSLTVTGLKHFNSRKPPNNIINGVILPSVNDEWLEYTKEWKDKSKYDPEMYAHNYKLGNTRVFKEWNSNSKERFYFILVGSGIVAQGKKAKIFYNLVKTNYCTVHAMDVPEPQKVLNAVDQA